jgi:NADH-quinone oxidoreductase subunit N
MPVYYLEFIVVALGLVLLMVDAFAKLEDKRSLARLGILGLAVVFCLLFVVKAPETAEDGIWRFYASPDKLSLFFKGLALLSTILVLIMAIDYTPIVIAQTANPEDGAHPQAGLGEFFALPLFACAGLMWMSSANHLVSIFVSLETVSITFYILVAYLRRKRRFARGGSEIPHPRGALDRLPRLRIRLALRRHREHGTARDHRGPSARKASTRRPRFSPSPSFLSPSRSNSGAAPFHLWIPDVYQGAPTPVTAFLSVGSKAAATIVTLRLVTPFLASSPLVGKITAVLVVVAILTLLVGNLAALPQRTSSASSLIPRLVTVVSFSWHWLRPLASRSKIRCLPRPWSPSTSEPTFS